MGLLSLLLCFIAQATLIATLIPAVASNRMKERDHAAVAEKRPRQVLAPATCITQEVSDPRSRTLCCTVQALIQVAQSLVHACPCDGKEAKGAVRRLRMYASFRHELFDALGETSAPLLARGLTLSAHRPLLRPTANARLARR